MGGYVTEACSVGGHPSGGRPRVCSRESVVQKDDIMKEVILDEVTPDEVRYSMGGTEKECAPVGNRSESLTSSIGCEHPRTALVYAWIEW